MDSKNSNTIPMSKKAYTKQDKIRNYRLKYANIRHKYYAMCEKYSSYNKTMLTFTIPSKINNAIIQGKYSKTAYLVELRTYIAKQFNNASSEIKYFSNIELGSKRNNPHLHIQVWTKSNTQNMTECDDNRHIEYKNPITKGFNNANNISIPSFVRSIPSNSTNIDEVYTIYKKTIEKFSLNNLRCKITLPEYKNKNYDYVIKDYRKDISDVELWANENAKKGIRKHLGKQVRFYNMSADKYSQKIYRIAYRFYNKLRKDVNEFISKFVTLFYSKSIDGLRDIRELNSKIVDILELELEQEIIRCCELGYSIKKATYHIQKLICYWIYGFI